MGWPADAGPSAHVFVDPVAGFPDTVDIPGEDGHHLARVLRLRVGEPVTVADGVGGWRPYRVAGVAGTGAGGAGRHRAGGRPDRVRGREALALGPPRSRTLRPAG